MSYTHAGGIDRPLVITKNGVSVIPHQNWRGMFALGTNPAGGRDVPDIDWPGFHTTPWHGPTRVVENWFGSLSTEMRDATGQLYKRNRYYDPASGQFTQPDPIGLAGGLNSYGFAEGDPVSYSDPYGLRIDWGDETVSEADKRRAKRVWDEMARRVNAAQLSTDPEIRDAGMALGRMLRQMWDDPERVYTVLVNNDGNFVGPDGGGLESTAGPGARLIQIADAPSEFTSLSPWMILVHELGGAYSSVRGGRHDKPAVGAENLARTIVGCKHRNRAHRFDSFELANPTCKR